MRVAIIGSGHISNIHGPLILQQPNIEIVGIADKDLARAKALATKLNGGSVYEEAEVMIREEKPDIVHVLVPPQYHASLSIMAMKQGCHVLVEKPLATTLADSERMVDIAKQNSVYLTHRHGNQRVCFGLP